MKLSDGGAACLLEASLGEEHVLGELTKLHARFSSQVKLREERRNLIAGQALPPKLATERKCGLARIERALKRDEPLGGILGKQSLPARGSGGGVFGTARGFAHSAQRALADSLMSAPIEANIRPMKPT